MNVIRGAGRTTTKRGRASDDVKHIKVPKLTHGLLYEYAKERGMTLGDAATRLIGIGLLQEYDLYDEVKLHSKEEPLNKQLESIRNAVMSKLHKTAQP